MPMLKMNFDVLSTIMSWVEHQTLLACCLVSKAHQSAALPFLYREVRLGWYSDHDSTPILTDLVKKPRLARLVRTLSTGLVERAEANTDPRAATNTFDPLAALGAFSNLCFLDLWVIGFVDIQLTTDAIASLSQLHSLTICTDKSEFMLCLFGRLSLCRPLRHLVVHDHTGVDDEIYLDSLVDLLCHSSETLRNWKPVMSESHETALGIKLRAASVVWEQVCYLFCRNFSMPTAAMFPNIRALRADVSTELLEILAQPALLPKLRTLHLSHLYRRQFTHADNNKRAVSQLKIRQGPFLPRVLHDNPSAEARSVVRCMRIFEPSAVRNMTWGDIYPEVLPIYAATLAQFSALEYLELYILTQFDNFDYYDENYDVCKECNYLGYFEDALGDLLLRSLPISLRYILLRRRASSNYDMREKPDAKHIASIGNLLSSFAEKGRHPGLRGVQLHIDSLYFTWRRPTGSPLPADTSPWIYIGDSSSTSAEPAVVEIAEWSDRQPDANCFAH